MSDGVVPLTPSQIATQEAQASKEGYLERNLIALDKEGNTLTGGLSDETLSARWARAAERGNKFGIVASKILDLFQKNHGPRAQAGDVERAKAVEALEENSPGLEK